MPLVKGLYGIPVPEKPIDCKLPDHCVLLVPVVAFTERAERLGQGGGYFDRFLTEHSQLLAIGIAHSCQQIDSFPVAGHDRPLDAVLTEAGWITANEKTRKRLNIVS